MLLKALRRRRLARAPFPQEWKAIIERNVPAARLLGAAERERLLRYTRIFLAEKRFEGCGGLELTDEIRVTIAAQACILLVGQEDADFYPMLRSILVYPTQYFAPIRQPGPGGVVTEGVQGRLGESWNPGYVVLSWDDARRGGLDPCDGHNVVLHEFAHQLDGQAGGTEGSPRLERRAMYTAWARIFGREFNELRASLQRGEPTLLRAYGATNPAEFFAVATEVFFEMPRQLRQRHPELYDQLRLYYAQDPAERGSPC